MANTGELLAAALAYAAAGIRVFPVLAGKKEPATAHGWQDATTDEAQIRAWWAELPYNIGIHTGPESGLFVIDVDPRNGGEWESPVQTATAKTGGGGRHFYFQWPAGVAKMRRQLKTGVDVQGAGKYVLAPPSVTAGPYEWEVPVPPVDAPRELLAEIAIAEGATTDERPGDRFNREMTWPQILEPYGWTVSHSDAEGVTYWTRPGKTEGVSASTNYMGSDLLYVFSTSTEFEAERGYDKFGVWAVLEHGGDIEAAASALAGPRPRLTGAPLAPAVASPVPALLLPSAAAQGYTSPAAPDHLLTQYVHYAGMLTDAAPEYHEAACLAVLAVLCAGMRVALAPFPDGLPVNLYVTLVGPSSLSRKSTAQAIARTFLAATRPNGLLPDRMTGERAIEELAQRQVAVWMPDELGILLQQIYQREFLRPLEELILTLYSGQDYKYQTLGRGETVIHGLDLSILGAATPESFAGSGRALSSGLLPRFGVVYPRSLPPSRPPSLLTEEHRAWRAGLLAKMRQVLYLCATPGTSRDVTMTAGALAALGALDQEFGKTPLTARLVTAAYKVTALMALAALRLEANEDDAKAAIAITRRWAAGATNLRRFLGRLPADVQHMEQVAIAREELRLMPATPTEDGRSAVMLRDFARRMNLPSSTLTYIIKTMESTGEVLLVVPLGGGEQEIRFA